MGAHRDKNEWRSLVRQMVATGLLRIDIWGYGGIDITDKGRALMKGEGAFLYREDAAVARKSARQPWTPRGDRVEEAPGDGEADQPVVL